MNIKELSRLCGVSVCTVSRVLNGRAEQFRIAAATAGHVMDMARKVDYRPNYLAHSLNIGRTYSIGLVFANTIDNYLGSIMEGVESHLRGTDYQTVVETGENDIWLQDQVMRRMLHRQTDGIIFYPEALPAGMTYKLPGTDNGRKHTVPVVVIGRTIPEARDQVMMADREAGAATARYFLEAGCRRFAILTRPTGCSSDRNRQTGFLETLKKAGVPATRRIAIEEEDGPSSESLRQASQADAIFGVNSSLLLVFIQALRGIHDVHAMRFVSVGAVEGADLMGVKLRTWSTPGRAIGKAAAETLLWRIETPSAPWKTTLVPLEWTR